MCGRIRPGQERIEGACFVDSLKTPPAINVRGRYSTITDDR